MKFDDDSISEWCSNHKFLIRGTIFVVYLVSLWMIAYLG